MVKAIIRYKAISAISFLSLAFILGGSIWAYLSLNSAGGGSFILHFNDMVGITSVGGLSLVLFMGILGIVAGFMNFFIAIQLEEKDVFLGKMMAGATLIFAILLFIAFAAIINVN